MSEFSVYLNGPDALKAEVLRQLGDRFAREDKILQLNRLVSSLRSENGKLEDQLASLKKAGDVSVIELMEELAIQYEDAYPRSKDAHYRREIANLHKVIGRLKDELRELRGE